VSAINVEEMTCLSKVPLDARPIHRLPRYRHVIQPHENMNASTGLINYIKISYRVYNDRSVSDIPGTA
jgi:hypothetical protein